MLNDSKITIPSTKQETKKLIKAMQYELFTLQQKLSDKKVPVVIIIEGFGASGKGVIIGDIISKLEPRWFKVYTKLGHSADDARKPFLNPFWGALPKIGETTILDHSWYNLVAHSYRIPKSKVKSQISSINTFERQLADDGHLIFKFFLHTGKEEQAKRFKAFEKNKATQWRVSEADLECNKNYDNRIKVFEDIISKTDSKYAPWYAIDNEKDLYGTFRVLTILTETIKKTLEGDLPITSGKTVKAFKTVKLPKLKEIVLDKYLSEQEYRKNLKIEKEKLRTLHSYIYQKKIPVVLAFEGWDAAGKGGAIRRLSSSMDPRGFEVIPVAAPSKEEISKHYLWRFWKSLPKDGHVAIYDRTWYGRVMVERLENITPEARWSKAYTEMNEFEKELTDWGAVVLKFWIHIGKDEQLVRFEDRQNTPAKQHKITDEDWRNRGKWEVYEQAVDEMIAKTNTKNAPWIVIEGNDKKYARVKVVTAVRKALEERLGVNSDEI